MNLSLLLSLKLSCPVPLGMSEDYNQWWIGNARCQKCNGKIPNMCGVICTNFGVCSFWKWTCSGVWHAQCYVQSEMNNFLVLSEIDLDRLLIDDTTMKEEDKDKFNVSHNGDQMMVPFQCELCHFLNIHNMFPTVGNYNDELTLTCI